MEDVAPITKRGPKPALTREAVIEVALELIDDHGLAALNLRKLAAALGVSAMTPYSYFDDKADLLNAMVEHALSALRVDPDSTAPWDAQLEGAMRGMHEALERHPGVIELVLAEAGGSGIDEFRRRLVRMLVAAGLSERQSTDALRTLTSYILGYTLLNRLRGDHRQPPDSFEHGLGLYLSALRAESQSQ